MKKHFTRPQKTTIVQGIQSIVLIIAILQLWLITATMNSYLGGDAGVPVPAAIFSLICLASNVGLLRFLYALDRTMASSGDKRKFPDQTTDISPREAPARADIRL